MDAYALSAPDLRDLPGRRIAGLNERYTMSETGKIPAQWERFSRYSGAIPGAVDGPAFGICHGFGAGHDFEYLCGVEVARDAALPREFHTVDVPAGRYAVFAIPDHVSVIQRAIQAVWRQWLPESGQKAASSPMVECYPESFDPVSGEGGFEIWLPLES